LGLKEDKAGLAAQCDARRAASRWAVCAIVGMDTRTGGSRGAGETGSKEIDQGRWRAVVTGGEARDGPPHPSRRATAAC